MKRLFILLSLSGFLIVKVQCQDGFDRVKWYLRASYGSTVSLNPKTYGFITDNLASYKNQSSYLQVISAGRFFDKWGIEFYYILNYNRRLKDRFSNFSNELARKYGDKYFMNIDAGCQYDYGAAGTIFERGSVGPVYKIENDRTLCIFRGLIGVVSFSTDWGSAYLKEKGTNSVIDVHWSAERPVGDFIAFNPSFTFGYRITKRIVLDVDFNYWIYKPDYQYKETATDFITGAENICLYNYSRMVNEISLGAGIMIILR